jgi:hypothetical protein
MTLFVPLHLSPAPAGLFYARPSQGLFRAGTRPPGMRSHLERAIASVRYPTDGARAVLFCGPFRHLARDVLNDLVTAVLVALSAVIASEPVERIWDGL